MKPIYLDYHATTPTDPRVFEVMTPYFFEKFGNSSSKQHQYGWESNIGIEQAREQVAQILGAESHEIYFTSGGTEANNLALFGAFETYGSLKNHILVSQVEHKSITESASYLESQGAKVTYLPVNSYGEVELDTLKSHLTDKTLLVSLVFANNEIGTLNRMQEIGELLQKHEVLFHTDAVQALGKTPIDLQKLPIDLLSVSSHKIYGPKGAGALYVRKKQPRIKLTPRLFGGGHEKGLRSGTLNTPSIVGFGAACKLAQEVFQEESERVKRLRDQMQSRLFESLPGLKINGHPQSRLYNNLSITVPNIKAHRIIAALPELALSTGSACSSQSVEPSRVLRAIGHSEEEAVSTIRFGLGRFTTPEEVDFATQLFLDRIKELRG